MIIRVSILLLFLFTVSFASGETLSRGNESLVTSNIRQLTLAIQMFHHDAVAKNGEMSFFPETLFDLVKYKYLTESDLRKLTQKYPVHYFKPSLPETDSDLPILFARCEDMSIIGSLSGSIGSYRDPSSHSSFLILFTTLAIFAVIVFGTLFQLHRRAQQDAAANP